MLSDLKYIIAFFFSDLSMIIQLDFQGMWLSVEKVPFLKHAEEQIQNYK